MGCRQLRFLRVVLRGLVPANARACVTNRARWRLGLAGASGRVCTGVPCSRGQQRVAARVSRGVLRVQAVAAPEAPATKKVGPIIMNSQVLHSTHDKGLEVIMGMTDYVEKEVSGLGRSGRGGRGARRRGGRPVHGMRASAPAAAAMTAPSCCPALPRPALPREGVPHPQDRGEELAAG